MPLVCGIVSLAGPVVPHEAWAEYPGVGGFRLTLQRNAANIGVRENISLIVFESSAGF
jgi:hypothetical protein